MSRHGMDPDLCKATKEHLHSIPTDEASRAGQWLQRGSLLGAIVKRLLRRSRSSQEPYRDRARDHSGTPAE